MRAMDLGQFLISRADSGKAATSFRCESFMAFYAGEKAIAALIIKDPKGIYRVNKRDYRKLGGYDAFTRRIHKRGT